MIFFIYSFRSELILRKQMRRKASFGSAGLARNKTQSSGLKWPVFNLGPDRIGCSVRPAPNGIRPGLDFPLLILPRNDPHLQTSGSKSLRTRRPRLPRGPDPTRDGSRRARLAAREAAACEAAVTASFSLVLHGLPLFSPKP
jgi:hypothetical protein